MLNGQRGCLPGAARSRNVVVWKNVLDYSNETPEGPDWERERGAERFVYTQNVAMAGGRRASGWAGRGNRRKGANVEMAKTGNYCIYLEYNFINGLE